MTTTYRLSNRADADFEAIFMYGVSTFGLKQTEQYAAGLEARFEGWYEVAVRGSHYQFKHPERPGRVTVPHPKTDLPKGTVNSILKQAGIK